MRAPAQWLLNAKAGRREALACICSVSALPFNMLSGYAIAEASAQQALRHEGAERTMPASHPMLPLEGMRIIDLTRVISGPFCTMLLGDLGADVIKIETPDRGDSARYLGVTSEELAAIGGPSPSFRAFNRNKRSIALDLGSAAGRDVARRLVSEADILVNNFRPGTMERWGLGYEDLKEAHPRLIYCDFTAYGSEGPLSHIGANDLALQAHSGLMSITGEEGGGPVRAGAAIIDLHASLAIVSGVLAALYHRKKPAAASGWRRPCCRVRRIS